MQIEKQIKVAMEFLKENKSFLVEGLRLDASRINYFEVTGWSQFRNFQNLTKKESIEELLQIKTQFYAILSLSHELQNFIKGKNIKYNLWFDDYGKASVGICYEENGVLFWQANIP